MSFQSSAEVRSHLLQAMEADFVGPGVRPSNKGDISE